MSIVGKDTTQVVDPLSLTLVPVEQAPDAFQSAIMGADPLKVLERSTHIPMGPPSVFSTVERIAGWTQDTVQTHAFEEPRILARPTEEYREVVDHDGNVRLAQTVVVDKG